MSPTTLSDDFRKLKGQRVTLHYGKTLQTTGVLVSWTSGANAKVWIENGRTDTSVPVAQVRKVEAA